MRSQSERDYELRLEPRAPDYQFGPLFIRPPLSGILIQKWSFRQMWQQNAEKKRDGSLGDCINDFMGELMGGLDSAEMERIGWE